MKRDPKILEQISPEDYKKNPEKYAPKKDKKK